MPKIGRNERCHCGSGKKYKKCHLREDEFRESQNRQQRRPSTAELDAIMRKHRTEAEIREAQQGRGRPIISSAMNDHRIVAVGKTVHWSKNWKTFPDFLNDYIKRTLDPAWGNAELKKPLAQRHIILQWYDALVRHHQKTAVAGKITSAAITGVVACYLGLAYSLYLIAHNADLQARLVKRLKDPAQFQGAYYELIVASTLIRAGFSLALEDETNNETKHCEFSATSRATGKKYWVEAKMRAVSGLLGKTDADGTKDENPLSHLSLHVTAALKKPATDDRLIFVDINAPFVPAEGANPAWSEKARHSLMSYERRHKEANAYVIVTNLPFHRMLDDSPTIMALPFGLGMPEFNRPGFMRLSEAYSRKQKHIDLYNICDALEKYTAFPATFDGSLPSELETEFKRVQIGETYIFPEIGGSDGTGTVTAATVNEEEKLAYIAITTAQGTSQILRQKMSDDAIADYKQVGDAYFGDPGRPKKRTLQTTYELFEWLMQTYSETSREQLLKLAANFPNIEELKTMSDSDLLANYCEAMAGAMENQRKK